ncbi:glycoside hydrolase family 94 protein [uncultured Pseudoxanthomonas sp.]|uniref:glycoside hydrolase family 94 protein n=1 Tax=uncultured Pseudoxanthomonas sp. TaxID=281701 RepID=UPI00261F8B7D|nr:glycoside hydrolase family 94 protein [uncultured Pseudoxanthomonas sp.]
MTNFRRTFGRWLRLRRRLKRFRRTRFPVDPVAKGEEPLRAQLLSVEQMEAYGRSLAHAHKVKMEPTEERLLARLQSNQKLLGEANDLLNDLVREELRISPAGEWLLDNYHVIEEQIQLARRHLPTGYSRQLPSLSQGALRGLPRVYALTIEAVSHGDGRIDGETLRRFIAGYQIVAPLKMGELWAVPIMLRLALIENLRRMASHVMRDGAHRRLASTWARRLNRAAIDAPGDVVLIVADMARSTPPLTGAFVAELIRRLDSRTGPLALPGAWLEQWVAAAGYRIDELVTAESQQQAADQVSIGNSIGSLRFLATMDWKRFVEDMSVVDRRLQEDPAGIYGLMDFGTRDAYRHVIEKIARSSGASEEDVAGVVVTLARAHAGPDGPDMPDMPRPQTGHVGYWLLDDGLDRTREVVARAAPGYRRARLRPRHYPLLAYLIPIAAIIALATWALVASGYGDVPLWIVVALSIVVFSELGIALVNWLATLLVAPRPLPRMDFSTGIPDTCRSVVAVPTMLSSEKGIDSLVEGMEVRFLANRDAQLRFVLLTDFLDAPSQSMPGDEALVAYAAAQIERLNRRYAPETLDRFFLLHRPRQWNASEAVWMGYERKRGKLSALNALILEGEQAPFMRIVGDASALRHAKYVITLDTDTRLPRDAAREFVATLAHPLNRPVIDPRRNVVIRGYGILQPSVGSSLSGRRPSRFATVFGSEPGIDPYTRTVSDVYQDLFGEGSFVGKGIYDVAAFEHVLAERLPENRILSHDLLEGCFARAGLVSDVRLYEDYPERYAADTKRRARWMRGDWQLLPWLLPRIPTADGTWERNPLSWLSRGKLLDNLRRSLVSMAALALFVIGWVHAPQPLAWTLIVLALWFAPVILSALKDGMTLPDDMPAESHWVQVGRATARSLQRAALNVACLAHEAWLAGGAIVRTLWRLGISRRHLLQWNPSSEVERSLAGDRSADWRGMLPGSVIAVGIAFLLLWLRPDALAIAGPLLLAWMWAPAVMTWLSHPPEREDAALSPPQRAFLGKLSRRTWSFFETWIREEDHWLPPDNIQEHPSLVVARRTSPTNIGLSLLANLAAWDFGYLQAGAVAERTRNVFDTLEQLPRHRGHFLNWYDTSNLQPLPPRYVSTVDSGNLAGHLLTLRQGLLAMVDAPILAPTTFGGIADTFGIVEEEAAAQPARSAAVTLELAAFRGGLAAIDTDSALSLEQAMSSLTGLQTHAANLLAVWPAPSDMAPGDRHWPQALSDACTGAVEALALFFPDAALPRTGASPGRTIPSLRQLATAGEDARASRLARERIRELERLAHLAGQFSLMEYGFLYDRSRNLLAIGFNVDDHRLDNSFYDLLASEVRLGVFVAIAQGQLPQESWFALGRLLTEVNGMPALLSWSGSMFEYLMPQLVMPDYPDTLLDQTMHNAVEAHIQHGRNVGLPWGVSESGYNAVDTRMNYQYRAFGVPGLGLKRGLSQDSVVAPYASMMALMVNPEAACENLQRLQALGFSGRFGLYEAIDYTPSRVPPGQECVLLRSFMAHHQGMGFLSLVHLLGNQPMQRRFVADAEFQATLLLLQERIPRVGVFHPHEVETLETRTPVGEGEAVLRVIRDPEGPRPEVQLLSNGRYHGLLSHAGGGYSRHHDMATTRWREDGTTDAWGTFCYLRDIESGEFWSTAHQPTCVQVDQYEAIFSDAKAEFRGRKHGYESHLEIAISPEDDMELRRLKIANRSRRARTIEITTYAEVVLAPPASDDAHPAFSNLFVQTEIVREKQALLCTRRPRAHDEVPPWLVHLVAVHDADVATISYETDRSAFLGRGNTPRAPKALTGAVALSDSEGSVLDPIVAIRVRVTLEPEQVVQVDMVYGVAASREASETLIDRYRDRRLADRVFDLAWTHSQVVRRQINATVAEAQLYERLASLVVYANPHLRAPADVLQQNQRGQSGLWGHAISGDLPIVLLKVHDADNIEVVRQLVQAHAYWRLKGLRADLVIWNDSKAGYRQQLQDQILGMISADAEASVLDRPGGIFVRPAQNMSQEDRTLLQAVARVLIDDREGTLAAQLGRLVPPKPWPAAFAPRPAADDASSTPASDAGDENEGIDPRSGLPAPWEGDEEQREALWPFLPVEAERMFDNGIGAFTGDGREYVVVSREGMPTPAPWCNVLANDAFGCVVSESSPGYTWFENAHEYRLSPWHNDPVSDLGGEAFYLRDDASGEIWSPTPLPCRGSGDYRTRHGFGYTVYEHQERGIHTELWIYVGVDEAVKHSMLRIRNVSGRMRTLSAFGYVEWVLGDLRHKSRMHVVTEVDPVSGALMAHNPFNTEFAGRTVFFDTDASGCSWTSDRIEFVGRNGGLHRPAALSRERLSGRVGVGLDPCAAIQVPMTLGPGEEREVAFRLGAAKDRDSALAMARRPQGMHDAHDALDAARIHWRGLLDSIQVRTPDAAFDALANGWLLYQTLGCRYLARSGYYQSGGAFGFRDQLQDTMATIHARPDLSRRHLLTSAAHQFPQGDVMHWWHPPQGRGVRTRCSDDYLWLPLATSRYLEVTADRTVLDEIVGFVEGREVNPDEEGYYDMPAASALRKTLYDHCLLALRRGCRLLGERGLPLIATGDWNDGMNRVGEGGRGESVWLGFFLVDTLRKFIPVAEARGDAEVARWCAEQADALGVALETHAWDGEWYRRAWFDDGTPIGSSSSDECRIDSISQSWSVLSGVADATRGQRALDALYTKLVKPEAGLVQLLDPPFDRTTHDPGYIRGYVPGVRENGGQYTHAAVWAAMAFAHAGDPERAWELARMINPVNHALDADAVQVYKAEPYVMAADVYAVAPHTGRGGWTWYTGSAGWMYRLMIESVLGVRRKGDVLTLDPRTPSAWEAFEVRYRFGSSTYRISVTRGTSGDATVMLDGVAQDALDVPLVDDGKLHRVVYTT